NTGNRTSNSHVFAAGANRNVIAAHWRRIRWTRPHHSDARRSENPRSDERTSCYLQPGHRINEQNQATGKKRLKIFVVHSNTKITKFYRLRLPTLRLRLKPSPHTPINPIVA